MRLILVLFIGALWTSHLDAETTGSATESASPSTPPLHLPEFKVSEPRVPALERRLEDIDRARQEEQKHMRAKDAAGKPRSRSSLPRFLRDPGEGARAILAEHRLKIMGAEESLLLAAATTTDPKEARELRKLAKELRFMREASVR